MDLLDELPIVDDLIEYTPDSILRWLFEAFRVEVRYNKFASWADCSVSIHGNTVDQLLANSFPPVRDETAGKRSLLVPPAGFEQRGRTLRVQISATYSLG
ncbi:MAG: hypothetical protein M3285_11620 [Actinomycetota bacterium]|nr:hypothetical protein [Actinomycetota bacterium]